MAERLGEALLDLDTNDKGLKAGIGRAERLAQGLGRTLDATAAKSLAIGRNLALAGAAGAAGLGVLVKRSIDAADEMSKAAARAGMTTEQLSRLAWAGELADVSLAALTTSSARLSNQMAEVASGGAKDTKALFDRLGISVVDLQGKLRPVGDVIYDLADVFAGMENGATKTALAMQIFGRSGAELIPLLNSGRQGLAAYADEADRLGKTISTQAGRDAEEFNDTLTRLGAVFDGLMLKIGTGLLPDLQALMNTLASPAFASAMQTFGSNVIAIARAIAEVFIGATKAFNSFMALVDNAQKSREQQAAGLSDAEIKAEQAKAKATLSNPKANSVAVEQAKAWLAALSRQERTRLKSDPIDAGATWDQLAGLGGARAPTGIVAPPDLSGVFNGLASGSDKARDAVNDLIASLTAERDALRETDPVQQRLISMRTDLSAATKTQRDEVEALLQTIYEETTAWENAQEAGQFFGDTLLDSIEAVRTGSKSLGAALEDLINQLARAVLQSMLLGQGPLAGLFGSKSAGGGLGGLLGGLFSGFFAKGGLIPSGTFGIVGERGPEPVFGTPHGAMVLPNSAMSGMAPPAPAGPLQVIVNGSSLSVSELTQAISDALDRFDRFRLPQRVAEINADPLARG